MSTLLLNAFNPLIHDTSMRPKGCTHVNMLNVRPLCRTRHPDDLGSNICLKRSMTPKILKHFKIQHTTVCHHKFWPSVQSNQFLLLCNNIKQRIYCTQQLSWRTVFWGMNWFYFPPRYPNSVWLLISMTNLILEVVFYNLECVSRALKWDHLFCKFTRGCNLST